MVYSLAIDIGASSGRHILGHLENGKMFLEEVYRFENYIKEENGTLCWDIEHLVTEVKNGLKKCKEIGKIPATIAIDTWGVDYVLLDENKKELFPAVAYRDSRTYAAMEEFHQLLSKEEFFAVNGIQPINFNTVYQLFHDKKSGKLSKAKHFLMIPAYLYFKLSGEIKNEYTNLTTGALVSAKTKSLDEETLNLLGVDSSLFGDVCLPTQKVGVFSEEIRAELGFDSTLVFCPTHDTASAVAACPLTDNAMYISSGTWSLVGTENLYPVLSSNALLGGFTNEGGINYRYRFLKNIMGMWLFQNIRKNLDKKYTYDEMMEMAKQSSYTKLIDPNAKEFVAPDNMIEAIREHLGEKELPIGDVLKSVYLSLANSYKNAAQIIENVCGKEIELINIVGGGSKDTYLNELTKEITGKRVLTGPTEGTATGNLIAQFMYLDKNLTLESMREIVKNSFDIKEI